jgi:hypothetical protein
MQQSQNKPCYTTLRRFRERPSGIFAHNVNNLSYGVNNIMPDVCQPSHAPLILEVFDWRTELWKAMVGD